MVSDIGMQNSKWEICLAVGDVAVFFAAIPVLLLWHLHLGQSPQFFPAGRKITLLILLSVNLLVIYVSDLYDKYKDYRNIENISRIIFAVWVGMVLGGLAIRFTKDLYLDPNFIEWHALCFSGLLIFWRYLFSALALPQRLRRRMLIVGAGDSGQRILKTIQERPNSGLEPIGFVDDDPQKVGQRLKGIAVLGTSDTLTELIRRYNIEIVVVAIIREKSPKLLKTLSHLSFNHCELVDMPTMYEHLAKKIPLDYISDNWLFLHSIYRSKYYYRHVKRLMDLALAAAGLLLAAPLLPCIALAIKLDSPGTVFFRQQRQGQTGKSFSIFKFRTMRDAAPDQEPQWAVKGDPRITRVGWFLRKARLDEVPQLINVLKGEMSLIGPRAEWDVFAQMSLQEETRWRPGRRAGDPPGFMVPAGEVERVPFYGFRSVVKPGITGWAQVQFPMAGSSFEDLQEKLAYDLYYIKNISLFLDLAILLKTIRIVLIGRGK
ncbi:exopolysaccharide biosynthesis polyprenyl glycosylphosphotransferase [Desulfobacca acetoxidans DSM 11109]|uniref:Exopolysaccharide biosynthesis polyprenyl glycosylphosphotransferase n=1 Tax=Desulfobacca acetoxidans (strain ATCC 700848 / DSM 11109 / ASRB2) TaxID=880072 RepID=F2NDF6_DESAR|nr:exopolysaccharide biosynthesis polyprenyl glycosylphosphotransferase [Desulfobacca acetoxidans DSM 11109]